jgi:hypothetical protein
VNRNGLYAIIAILVVGVAGFAFFTYQQENKPGVELKANEDGISIKKN